MLRSTVWRTHWPSNSLKTTEGPHYILQQQNATRGNKDMNEPKSQQNVPLFHSVHLGHLALEKSLHSATQNTTTTSLSLTVVFFIPWHSPRLKRADILYILIKDRVQTQSRVQHQVFVSGPSEWIVHIIFLRRFHSWRCWTIGSDCTTVLDHF